MPAFSDGGEIDFTRGRKMLHAREGRGADEVSEGETDGRRESNHEFLCVHRRVTRKQRKELFAEDEIGA